MKKLDPGLIAVLVSLLIVGGGFGISHLTNILSPTKLWASFAIISVITGLSIWLGLSFMMPIFRSAVAAQSEALINSVNATVEGMELKFSSFENRMDVFRIFQDPDWVITTKDLIERELTLPQKEVWIVSSYLGAELDEGLFAPVIEANTKRGVRYYYVIPDDHQVRARIQAIRSMVSTPYQIHAIQIDERNMFQLLSTHDTCIFDPFERSHGACRGYMNVPNDLNDVDYFVKLGPDYCQRLASTVKAIGTKIDLDTTVD